MMKKILLITSLLLMCIKLSATEKKLGASSGRWVKIARIQNVNPINGTERTSFSGTINAQTDIGQTGSEQYYGIFSFGSRGIIRPLLQEFGAAANRPVNDLSRIEWRIYKDADGWHYLWLWQSNFSKYTTLNYEIYGGEEYWTFEDPPANYTQIWSSIGGKRQVSNSYSLNVVDKLGIGTTSPKNELSVNGTIWAKKVKVQLEDAADWVFDEDYKLRPLSELKDYIKVNKHLPEIPSAEEFKANDMEVSEMTNKLLQKIEELTLYTIDQEKKIEKVAILEQKNKALEARLLSLENAIIKLSK